MHTKQVEHNGHTIEIVSYDGLGTVNFTYFVKGEGFKKEGYASLSAAKGAITKQRNLKAEAAKMPILSTIKAATSETKARMSVPVPVRKSRIQREGRYSGTVNGKPARYYPGAEDRTVESFTSHWHFPNRKARKQASVEFMRRQFPHMNNFGGKIVNK